MSSSSSDNFQEVNSGKAQLYRSPYKKITNDLRQDIIQEICNEGLSLRNCAQKHNLKYSTVKGIVKIYQTYGRSSKKEKRNRKFFLKRNNLTIQIDLQNGNIQLYQNSGFGHVEIVQGGNEQSELNISKNGFFQSHMECVETYIQKDFQPISRRIYNYFQTEKELFTKDKVYLKFKQEALPLNANSNSGNYYHEECSKKKQNNLEEQLLQYQDFLINKVSKNLTTSSQDNQNQLISNSESLSTQYQLERIKHQLRKQFQVMKSIIQ